MIRRFQSGKTRRILFVTPCWPHDRAFGGQLRALNVARALQQLGEVTVAVASPDVAGEETRRRTAGEFQLGPVVRLELTNSGKFVERCRRAFDSSFMNVHGCVGNDGDRAQLFERTGAFDLVWVMNSRTPNILQRWKWPHAVLDLDDVPSTYQRTIWQNGARLKDKLKAGATMILMRRREQRWKERFSVLGVCSEADRKYLGGGRHIHVIPNGFDRPAQESVHDPVEPVRFGFIGLYSYFPNREGVEWFVRECWAHIKQELPDARLRLVGRGTDGPLKPVAPDLDALGWVSDPAAEISTWSAMIIPVRHGAGTRIKIADAFSRKCPVVSTPLGAFGYEVGDGRELLLADGPREFAAACVALARDRARAAAMAERAYRAFLNKWTWDAIAPKVVAAAEDCLQLHAMA
jgi:glycosyltransferase involved in cell wall biosynthesis